MRFQQGASYVLDLDVAFWILAQLPEVVAAELFVDHGNADMAARRRTRAEVFQNFRKIGVYSALFSV